MEELLELYSLDAITAEEFEEGFAVRNSFRIPPIQRCVQHHGRFDLQKLNDTDCKLKFRFYKEHLSYLANALGIPEVIRTKERYQVTGVEALCMLLRRLVYPNRLYDLEELFGVSAPYMSVIINNVMQVIYQNKGYLLDKLNYLPWLNEERLEYYAQAVQRKGAALASCWGFIDGTARAICRPSVNQQSYFSGHKRHHCVKYQSVLAPDGLIINMYGPCEGRRHDAGILRDSGLYEQLQERVVFGNKKYVLYGDSGYPIRELLLRPYTNHNLGNEERPFNNLMSAIRQPVEWGFGKIISIFAFLDYRKNQKLLLQDVRTMYLTATLLTNCHSCLYGNQTAEYFGVHVPALEDYLQI